MDNESEVIREQMELTRTSLQDKLETLELQVKDTVQEVKDTVQGAAEAASDTVQTVKDAVEDTVGTVKDTVQETIGSVKDTLEDTMYSVKESLDIAKHVREHPCLMFFGAVGVGFVGSHLLAKASKPVSSPPAAASTPVFPPSGPTQHRNGKRKEHTSEKPGLLARLASHYSDEFGKLEGLAVGALAGMVREMLANSVPPAIGQQLTEILDGVTTKLGGTPISGPLFQGAGSAVSKGYQEDVKSDAQWTKTPAQNPSRCEGR